MFVVVAGAGKVGRQLVKNLLNKGHAVVVLDKREDICEQLSRDFDNAIVLCGDSCEPTFLEQAYLNRADVVAAVTGDDEDNLVICQVAKEKFGVKRTVARVNDSRNTPTFIALGVDVPVDSSTIITQMITDEVSSSEMNTLLTFKRGKLSIVQLKVGSESEMIGKAVMNLSLPKDTVLISILRGEEVIVPKGNTVIYKNDEIVAITTTENKEALMKMCSNK